MYLYQELSQFTVEAFYSVHSALGPGLLEGCYHKALLYELEDRGIPAASQVPFRVFYKNRMAGEYFADLVIDGKILVEVKAVSAFSPVMECQVLNYLRVSGLTVGFLVNFAPRRVVWRRLVLESDGGG
jgi:GxxExxY protein